MRFTTTVGFFMFVAGISASPVITPRLAGGSTASIYTYKYVVQLLRDNSGAGAFSQECAGSLITFRHVLTAAHCFTGPYAIPSRWQVRAGSPNRLSGGTIRNVVQIINHPTFNAYTGNGDISVAIVNVPFPESTSIGKAWIPPQGSGLYPNTATIAIGWGATSLNGARSNLLRQVSVPVWNSFTCINNYQQIGRTITNTMFCAGAPNQGICTGDNGGPLVLNNQVYGVASWYTGCGNALYPGVFTNVGSYTNWIVNIANST